MLAATAHDRVETTLQHAFQELHRPVDTTKKAFALRALIDGVTATMPAGKSPQQRAQALWRLIQEEIRHVALTDERAALIAALHVDPTNEAPSIDKRLVLARDRGDFGVQHSGRPHGYDAVRHWWGAGVRILGDAVDERLDFLRDHPTEWQHYFNDTVKPVFRPPSPGAQPIFAELFVTTVIMKGRYVHRRITERVIRAQEDHVEYYEARALRENEDASTAVPVRSIWNCRAESVRSSPGEPIITRLWFPSGLMRGQKHYFSSEALVGDIVVSERLAIDVEVDHHGIAPGQRMNSVPVSGLTIRVRFDEDDVPEACWWYADVAERERYVRPSPGDDRWLTISPLGTVEHTFTEPCQPRAHYGVGFGWPAR